MRHSGWSDARSFSFQQERAGSRCNTGAMGHQHDESSDQFFSSSSQPFSTAAAVGQRQMCNDWLLLIQEGRNVRLSTVADAWTSGFPCCITQGVAAGLWKERYLPTAVHWWFFVFFSCGRCCFYSRSLWKQLFYCCATVVVVCGDGSAAATADFDVVAVATLSIATASAVAVSILLLFFGQFRHTDFDTYLMYGNNRCVKECVFHKLHSCQRNYWVNLPGNGPDP